LYRIEKSEVPFFVCVAKLGRGENRSFVSNRNWVFRRWEEPGRRGSGAGEGVLNRLAVAFEIFTDSSSSCGMRNAKGCVCTFLLPGKGRRRCREIKGTVKDARLKCKSRRPLPFDPAVRDLRMNRAVARFTNSKAKARSTAKSKAPSQSSPLQSQKLGRRTFLR
jgi:hypothetical protein